MNSKFLNYVEDVRTVLILISQPLDFDCIGSGLLMKKYLESLGKKVLLVFPRKISPEEKEFNSILPYFNEIKEQDTLSFFMKPKFDLLVFLDGMNIKQFVDRSTPIEKYPNIKVFPKRVHIDHHSEKSEDMGTFIIHNAHASSTAEIILNEIIPDDFLDEKISLLGYAALLGDTGNFKWHFTPQTLKTASRLLEHGADPQIIFENMMFSKTIEDLQAISYITENINLNHQTQTVFVTLSRKKLTEDKVSPMKLDLVKRIFPNEVARSMKGYPRGILIWEEKENFTIISARGSTLYNKLNMPDLFKEIGGSGGGHLNACSFSFNLSAEEVEKKVIEVLKNYL
jgi:nanoRNase/pAp phosphatase (c-di-AMP/oligoRNAs hydrolase)